MRKKKETKLVDDESMFLDDKGMFLPVIEVGNIDDKDNICLLYHYDGSGSITLFNNNEFIFHREDGKINHHIEYLKEEIKESKLRISICEKGLTVLKKYKKKAKL
jgi:hypothetical protein